MKDEKDNQERGCKCCGCRPVNPNPYGCIFRAAELGTVAAIVAVQSVEAAS